MPGEGSAIHCSYFSFYKFSMSNVDYRIMNEKVYFNIFGNFFFKIINPKSLIDIHHSLHSFIPSNFIRNLKPMYFQCVVV